MFLSSIQDVDIVSLSRSSLEGSKSSVISETLILNTIHGGDDHGGGAHGHVNDGAYGHYSFGCLQQIWWRRAF